MRKEHIRLKTAFRLLKVIEGKDYLGILDIHTHITPGVDDGAKDRATSVAMLKKAKEQGVTGIILTPHFNERTGMTKDPREGFDIAEEDAGQLGIEVYRGNEVYFSGGAMEALKSGKLFSLAGTRYVLAEFSYSASYEDLHSGVNEFLLSGFRPVIAHVERYNAIYKSYVYDFLNMGALLQVNASSILSGGFKLKGLCKKLLKEELVSFIASDCHNLTDRAPNLGECETLIRKKYGGGYSDKLFFENAQRLVQGKDIVV